MLHHGGQVLADAERKRRPDRGRAGDGCGGGRDRLIAACRVHWLELLLLLMVLDRVRHRHDPGVAGAGVGGQDGCSVSSEDPPAVRSTRSRIGFGMKPSSSSSSAVATRMTWSQNDTLFFFGRLADVEGSGADAAAVATLPFAPTPLFSVCCTTWLSISTSRISSWILLCAMS
uniref:Uncharacterized protein n=1 Tax=Anopheles atroparvus TaxID=41427 RepID=A0A182JI13_ANOAO